MTRPQPGDMAPNGALSINGDVYTIGNPELDPYFAENYDLGLEWYFGESGLGVIALNAWRKEIEGYTTDHRHADAVRPARHRLLDAADRHADGYPEHRERAVRLHHRQCEYRAGARRPALQHQTSSSRSTASK